MPRRYRYIEPNGYYHIISRSINDTWILKDQKDFQHFLYLGKLAKHKFPLRIFHYVLMNTHFHYVVQTKDKETLAKHLSFLKWRYTMWTRERYGWKGPLWRERYKSLPIEDETYLINCGTYIEYNPVRAGICTDPADYLYSSYHKYHRGIPDPLLDKYEAKPDWSKVNQEDFVSSPAKKVYSHTPAIGSSLFIERFRASK